jgi:anthranilate phosphoribosyltransferase
MSLANDNIIAEQHMRSLLQRIATGPELSKNVSREEARLGMEIVLQGRVNPVQAGLYLIALRMKRETDDEVLGIQQALLEETRHIDAQVDELVEITDPFNGYVRGLPMSPFIPAVLAASGVPAVCHGVETSGPKYGVTHHKVLFAAGENVAMSLVEAAERVGDPDIGWAYVDQCVTCPKLHQLQELRDLMVKRTCLTTIEVVLKPMSARYQTHLVTGYVHKAYPPVYTMLARNAGYQSALIVRGVEGGIIPSLQQPSKAIRFAGEESDKEWRLQPGMAGIFGASHRAVPIPGQVKSDAADGKSDIGIDDMASAAAACAMAALQGTPGLAYDSLVYSGSVILAHLGRGSLEHCAQTVRNVLDKGLAAARIGK